jgi:hypothetical protein
MCFPIVALPFTWRHNTLLSIIGSWLSVICVAAKLYLDLPGWPSPSILFSDLRPDITIELPGGENIVIELSVCHEMNLVAAQKFKQQKYSKLQTFDNRSVKVFTIEVTVLGFYKLKNLQFIQKYIFQQSKTISPLICRRLTHAALRTSFFIYCRRNKTWPTPELLLTKII